MSTLFLFGAGASNGSLDCTPYCPPLGCKLFNELQDAGGIARTIRGELSDLFQRDFEKGMDTFFDECNEDVAEFLRDMAKYFAQFEPGPKNLYRKLIDALRESTEELIFSTVNYDLLIEIAATEAGLIVYHNGRPFLRETLPLLKLHGSCNFLPKVRPGQIRGARFKMGGTAGTILKAPVIPATPKEVIEFCQREDSIAPAIAMYAPSKWLPFCRDYIEKQRRFWQAEVYRAQSIYVIGAGLHEQDTHIWEPLAKSTAWLGYVGPESDDFYRWANSSNRKQVSVVAKTFEDAIPLIA